jgi:phosphatidylinositol glycan class C protein
LKLFGYGMGLYVLSPVLAALTDPISDDTIAALSIILLVIHLSFQDYGYLNPEPPRARNIETKSPTTPVRVPARTEFVNRMRKGSYGEASFTAAPSPLYHAPVSLNAGIFASLMMASRLSSHNLAFVIIALAVEMFALFPIMAHHLKVRSWWGSFLLVVGLVASAVFLLQRLSNLVTYIYIGTIIFATFVSPFCLQWIQRYKNEIHGPWDEAVPARARRHGTRH